MDLRTDKRIRLIGTALVIAAGVWGVCAWCDVGGQRQLFHAEGRHAFDDYYKPWKCAHEGYAQTGETRYAAPDGSELTMGAHDRCYPAFALLPQLALPYSTGAAVGYSAVGAALFMLSLLAASRGRLWPFALAGSMPVLFALERGNPVWLSAACAGIFLAWWDDESEAKRMTAAVCLAVAGVTKIAPFALGALYLCPRADGGRRRLRYGREAAVAAASGAVLFVLPWLAVPDGFGGIALFLTHAREHAEKVVQFSAFGFVQLGQALRVATGMSVDSPWTGMTAVARISQLVGLCALLAGAWRRNYLLLVGGMLLAAGNMYYYGALYLLPVFVLEVSRAQGELPWPRLALWLVLFCPLQLPVMGHGANFVLGNLATMGLMAADLVRRV